MHDTMTDAEFDRRYAEIEHKAGEIGRERSKFLVEASNRGWTQERIAVHIKKGQPWVSRQLLFGQFLAFMPTGIIANDLTERDFREHWEETDAALGEKDRFRAICRALGIETPAAPPSTTVPVIEGNLDAVVIEFGRSLGLNIDSPSWEARKSEIKGLLTKGTEHLRRMVFRGRGSVGLGAAYQFARDKSPEEQDAATVDDVKGYRHNVRETRESSGGEEAESKLKRNERRAQLAEWQRQQNEAAINAARRRAGKPPISDAEFGRPPPELLDQQYPGRPPGVTYANVHREQHGPIWHNVSKRRQQTLALKLKELAAELEKAVEDFGILDPEQQASVRKRWRIAAERIRPSIDLSERAQEEVV